MQPGYSKRSAKSKSRKAANKLKKSKGPGAGALKAEGAPAGGDIDMMDTAEGIQGAPAASTVADLDIDSEGGDEEGGRAGHSARVQLKRDLKVRVKQLKVQRLKLTKLPADKGARREITGTLKGLIMEQQAALSKPAEGGKGKEGAVGDGGEMGAEKKKKKNKKKKNKSKKKKAGVV